MNKLFRYRNYIIPLKYNLEQKGIVFINDMVINLFNKKFN